MVTWRRWSREGGGGGGEGMERGWTVIRSR